MKTIYQEANRHHPTIKFAAEISDKEIACLGTRIYKGARFEKESIRGTHRLFSVNICSKKKILPRNFDSSRKAKHF